MLPAALLAVLVQAPPAPPPAEGPSRRPALPALAAKAPGHPAYGLQFESAEGRFVFTNLRYTAASPRGSATLYRVTGPAGQGPYRLGVQLAFRPKFLAEANGQKYYSNMFYLIEKAVDGGAAKEAGLDEDWAILKVDGKDFGWNLGTLIAYLTSRPAVDILALKQKGWGAGSRKRTFQVQLRKETGPVDPADGSLVPENVPALVPHLQAPESWFELVRLRASTPRFAPLPVEAGGERLWVVRGGPNPHPPAGEDGSRIFLEFWKENPAAGPRQNYPAALWAEPTDGLLAGRTLRIGDRWVQAAEAALAADRGRIEKLVLRPWTADIPALLAGTTQARHLGPGAALPDRESLEQLANDSLVEWKTRALPGLLSTQDLEATEDLVIRLEKGVLALDLEVKAARVRLDAAARAEAERKAQAELAARQGQAAPPAAAPPADSERIADLLDQRKAILMAILGSAKQALAGLRR